MGRLLGAGAGRARRWLLGAAWVALGAAPFSAARWLLDPAEPEARWHTVPPAPAARAAATAPGGSASDRAAPETAPRAGGLAPARESAGDEPDATPVAARRADAAAPAEQGSYASQLGGAAGLPVTLSGSGFSDPLFATAPPGDGRLFVVEQGGRIWIVEEGVKRATPFLDLSGRVLCCGERGMLGLAFAPDHATSGVFYVFYTRAPDGRSVLSRLQLGADPNAASASTEEVLLTVAQPFANHNGGTVAFRPDGTLFVGLGDGGSSNDPAERAQNGQELLGKLLRLDVSGGPGTPYAIPADNPFVGNPNVRNEIWALGLRNPYRFTFDRGTGDLFIADVGQGLREEVDYEPAGDPGGRNWGWDVMEGLLCNATDPAPAPPCNDPSFTPPLHEYAHANGNCSITGGSVYRGSLVAIQGAYFFGDYCSGRIWSLVRSPFSVTERTAELGPAAGVMFQLAAIGEGGFGALYAVHLGGNVYRIGPGGTECADGQDNDGDGAVDGADTGCQGAADPWERDSDTPCDDGYDNDRDGDVDFPDDLDCTAADSAGEMPADAGGDGGGGGGGSCGLSIEVAIALPILARLRRRRGRAAA